jgi:hypothetical protein
MEVQWYPTSPNDGEMWGTTGFVAGTVMKFRMLVVKEQRHEAGED